MKFKAKAKEITPDPMYKPLHVRLRPSKLDEVIGQDAVVKALKRTLQTPPKAFLFTGPSGVGKTTLARIVGAELKAQTIEIDAASNSGVEEMRTLVEHVAGPRLAPGNLIVIVDECHTLSKSAWQSVLKPIEEPPAHLYWAFCTTEAGKVPDTIKTRCHTLDLKQVKPDTLLTYAKEVIKQEGLDISDEIARAAADKSNGSVRQLLVYLAALDGVDNVSEARGLLATAEERKEVVDFIRYLAFDRAPSFMGACNHIKLLRDAGVEAESIRIVLLNYLSAVVLNAKRDEDAQRMMTIMANFSQPYNASEKMAPLLLSTANILLSSD